MRRIACSPLIGSGSRMACGSGSAATRLQVYASLNPAPTRTSSTSRRSRCSLVRWPTTARRSGIVVRHAVEDDACNLLDDVDLPRHVARPPCRDRHIPLVGDIEAEPLEDGALLVASDRRARRSGRYAPAGAGRRAARAARRGRRRAPASSPPARSTINRLARIAAGSARYGSTPFSQRFDPSVRSPSRSDVRKTPIGSKFAASSSTSRRLRRHLAVCPAHDRRERNRLLAVGDQQVSLVDPSQRAVEGCDLLARPGVADCDASTREPRAVEGVQRASVDVHHVVRDVDDVGDRAHARGVKPGAKPHRRCGRR